MKIQSININNFKSIVDITIDKPNPFTVFVGANGSGKSNIFEALEFVKYSDYKDVIDMFGGQKDFLNRNSNPDDFSIHLKYCSPEYENLFLTQYIGIFNEKVSAVQNHHGKSPGKLVDIEFIDFSNKISRIFYGNSNLEKIKNEGDTKLSISGINLKKVLKRLLNEPSTNEEINDWLNLFIPEYSKIDIEPSHDKLELYQNHYEKPFEENLISDGTKSIIALLTIVLQQTKEPQFLCIEEPENGLNPKVIKELVNFFRDACEQYGHYIWLNTHSQTLVSVLEPNELILVDKIEGQTKIKQFGKDFNLHGFTMDEAWFTNALGGGMPW